MRAFFLLRFDSGAWRRAHGNTTLLRTESDHDRLVAGPAGEAHLKCDIFFCTETQADALGDIGPLALRRCGRDRSARDKDHDLQRRTVAVSIGDPTAHRHALAIDPEQRIDAAPEPPRRPQ